MHKVKNLQRKIDKSPPSLGLLFHIQSGYPYQQLRSVHFSVRICYLNNAIKSGYPMHLRHNYPGLI